MISIDDELGKASNIPVVHFSPSREENLLSDHASDFLGCTITIRGSKQIARDCSPHRKDPTAGLIQVRKMVCAALMCFCVILTPLVLSLSAFAQEGPQPNSPIKPNAKPKAHSVNLNWKASTSVVVGYNVYRADKSEGPFTKLNSSPVGKTNYKDTEVQAGHIYFYKVSAVDAKGTESAATGQIKAVVPTP